MRRTDHQPLGRTTRIALLGLAGGLALAALVLLYPAHEPSVSPDQRRADNTQPEGPTFSASGSAATPGRAEESPAPIEAMPITVQEGFRQPPANAAEPSGAISGADAAAAIDWDTIIFGSSIPKTMPARESDDPLEAGFAPQWVQRVYGDFHIPSVFTTEQERSGASFRELALPIASERKDPEDSWAYGMEYELRRILREAYGNGSMPLVRVFCNSHGCLCYVEGAMTSRPYPLTYIGSGLADPRIRRDFGITVKNMYLSNGGRGPLSVQWQMAIIERPGVAKE